MKYVVLLAALCLATACKNSAPARDAAADAAKCAAAITAKCEVAIATKCDAGDEQCPAYLECMKQADAIEAGELCGAGGAESK